MPSKSRYGIHIMLCVISGLGREVNDKCALLGCYAASSGNSLPTFRDNLSILPSSTATRRQLCVMSRDSKSLRGFVTLENGIGCSGTSVTNCHYSLCNSQEERSSHILRSLHALVAQKLVSSW